MWPPAPNMNSLGHLLHVGRVTEKPMSGRKLFPIQNGNKSVSDDIVRLHRLFSLSSRVEVASCADYSAVALGGSDNFRIRTSANRVSGLVPLGHANQ